MCCHDRVQMPLAIRNASQPKTMPDAPTVTVPAGAISQTPSPETNQTSTVTAMNCRMLLSVISVPMITSGTRFDHR